MLRQIESGVQNGFITKKRVLPVTLAYLLAGLPCQANSSDLARQCINS